MAACGMIRNCRDECVASFHQGSEVNLQLAKQVRSLVRSQTQLIEECLVELPISLRHFDTLDQMQIALPYVIVLKRVEIPTERTDMIGAAMVLSCK